MLETLHHQLIGTHGSSFTPCSYIVSFLSFGGPNLAERQHQLVDSSRSYRVAPVRLIRDARECIRRAGGYWMDRASSKIYHFQYYIAKDVLKTKRSQTQQSIPSPQSSLTYIGRARTTS